MADQAGALGTHAAPAVPALVRGRQGSAQRRPRSARIRSAWRRPRCAWPASCSRTCGKMRVLFVGAGEMIELAATHFAARKPAGAWPSPTARWSAARSSPAASAPRRCAWPTCRRACTNSTSWSRCTASSLPIIGLGAVERALKARKHRPMFMVDLAVPRDIEPEVERARRRLPLHRRRPAGAGADRPANARRPPSRRPRRSSMPACRASCTGWTSAARVPLIQAAQRAGRRLARRRDSRARASCWPRGENVDAVLDALSRGLTQKMLHGAHGRAARRRRRAARARWRRRSRASSCARA